MDQQGAPQDSDQATPIFNAYRRGYDPEQVDRYVADQQRRLDEATARASEAERRLAAAVGQLRELHRRVAVLESEDRSPQTPALDTLGERVQRILQEAWEGAYALRQGAEQEVGELRSTAAAEAESIVETARNKARAMEEATERRRQAFLERVEEDRNRALAQISYLHDQRRLALGELVKVKEVIEATVGAATFPASQDVSGAIATEAAVAPTPAAGRPQPESVGDLLAELAPKALLEAPAAPVATGAAAAEDRFEDVVVDETDTVDLGPSVGVAGRHDDPRPTLAVQHLGIVGDARQPGADEPARRRRSRVERDDRTRRPVAPAHDAGREAPRWDGTDEPTRHEPAGVFDFEADQP